MVLAESSTHRHVSQAEPLVVSQTNVSEFGHDNASASPTLTSYVQGLGGRIAAAQTVPPSSAMRPSRCLLAAALRAWSLRIEPAMPSAGVSLPVSR